MPSALARIGGRDPDDWPVLACALLTGSPIWTEDRDFFGAGVATWTTALVELYFTEPDSELPDH
jgi:predicted nucleic acid-binding protein